MGHKSEDTFLSYLSDTSGLNVQDMVNGQQPDNSLMENLQSMVLSFRGQNEPGKPDDASIIKPAEDFTSYQQGVVRPAQSTSVKLILNYDEPRSDLVDRFYGPTVLPRFNDNVTLMARMADTGPRPALNYAGVQDEHDKRCPYCGHIFLG